MSKVIKYMYVLLAVLLVMPLFSVDSFATEELSIGEYYEGKEIVAILRNNGENFYFNKSELDNFKAGLYDEYFESELIADIQLTKKTVDVKKSVKNAGAWSRYETTSTTSPFLYGGKAQRVTAEYRGPCTVTVEQSREFGYECNYTLSIGDRNSIGGTWSAKSSTSVSGAFEVPSGRRGYILFTPRYVTKYVTRYDYFDATLLETVSLVIKQPIKVNGFADGLYELRTVSGN